MSHTKAISPNLLKFQNKETSQLFQVFVYASQKVLVRALLGTLLSSLENINLTAVAINMIKPNPDVLKSVISGIIEKRRNRQRTQWLLLKPHCADVSEKFETSNDELCPYRLAKARCRQAEDIEKFFGINDENGHLLMDRERAVKRWHDYFQEISNVEFAHPAIPFASDVYGPVQ
ncbi:unnamed protein product [Heligmosomoides polygyrus]|uniref:Uncharacterized protein n=1 Tax=Heligmosomoides polygyrus TaxID=6339 RepID=A0A183F8L3_HELPZ|nr:unnamed protein product [Heligmosomoides polygyrus]